MLTIRLQRTGKKNQADFRIVLAEKESPVSKKFVEILGSYNPRKKTFQVKEERLKYWISKRVELSETMNNLLVSKKLVDGPKVKAFSIPKKPAAPVEASADAKAMADKPAEVSSTTESPTEVAEATAVVEEKVETAAPAPEAEESKA